MSKLAVVFPGIGYHADKPLLYYSKKIAKKCGYEVIELAYDGFPADVKDDNEKRLQCFHIARDKAEEILASVKFDSYDDILFISKSVGTTVAGAYARDHKLNVRNVIYTPVPETFDYDFRDAIAFHGTSDPWADTQLIKDGCAVAGIPVYITADANHSMETGEADTDIKNMARIMQQTEEYIKRSANENLKQALNPYLPSWEYIPDGEPYVFGDRVYIYGSHDKFGGDIYCMLDYVCYSAPIDDLGNWRYEGVIYKKTQDPDNADGMGKLYAPDVTRGADGRYYLFYAINTYNHISVAVCDTPAGKYEFHGYVHYKDGTRLGDKEQDEMQFDPGVLTEGKVTYLYTGFCPDDMESRHGAMLTVLGEDMLTIEEAPIFVAPSAQHSKGSGFEGHEFFEGPSIRMVEGKYTFIYSSVRFHELCYAQSDDPRGPFTYKGVIISNGDLGIDTYKPADKCSFLCANNHGSVEKIGDDYYIFYHRHTNGTNYSRQECFEKLEVSDDGTIKQAMMTSCCSIAPLTGKGTYPTYIACNLFNESDTTYIPWSGWMEDEYAKITQDGGDGDMNLGYITNMTKGTIAGFKSFDCKGMRRISIVTKGYGNGDFEVRLSPYGECVARITVHSENEWIRGYSEATIPDGIHDLYFAYTGDGWSAFKEFTLE